MWLVLDGGFGWPGDSWSLQRNVGECLTPITGVYRAIYPLWSNQPSHSKDKVQSLHLMLTQFELTPSFSPRLEPHLDRVRPSQKSILCRNSLSTDYVTLQPLPHTSKHQPCIWPCITAVIAERDDDMCQAMVRIRWSCATNVNLIWNLRGTRRLLPAGTHQ
jgi:hypothetical protein